MKSSPQKIYFSRQNCQNSKVLSLNEFMKVILLKQCFLFVSHHQICFSQSKRIFNVYTSHVNLLIETLLMLFLVIANYLYIYFYFFYWNRIKIDYVVSSKWHCLCKTNLDKWSECLPFFIIIAGICSVTLMYSFLKITVPNRTITFVMHL